MKRGGGLCVLILAMAGVFASPVLAGPLNCANPDCKEGAAEPCYRLTWRIPNDPYNGDIWRVCQGSGTLTNEFQATVTATPNGNQLQVTNLRPNTGGYHLVDISFPWVDAWVPGFTCPTTGFKLDSDGSGVSDDIILSAHVLGVGSKVVRSGANPYEWSVLRYPGGPNTSVPQYFPVVGSSAAPLMIRTDHGQAKLLAATNWDNGLEPKPVLLAWACNGWQLWYIEDLPFNASTTYRYSLWSSDGSPIGAEPWVDVALDYQSWLQARMQTEGISPASIIDPWVQSVHGFLDVQLENELDMTVSDRIGDLFSTYKTYDAGGTTKAYLPWVQFWGQMADYAGRDSCCLACRGLNDRFVFPDPAGGPNELNLVNFASQVNMDTSIPGGGRVGFYTIPFNSLTLRPALTDAAACIQPSDAIAEVDASYYPEPYPDLAIETTTCPMQSGSCGNGGQTPKEWFGTWLANATLWGARAYYYDTFGGLDWGPPLEVARLWKSSSGPFLSGASVTEWTVDVLPSAALGSGGLFFSPTAYPGGKGKSELEDIWDGFTQEIRFPSLVSLVLNDRPYFTGQADDGHYTWGLCFDHWAERKAFVLGHKFDVSSPYERMSDCSGGGCPIAGCDYVAAKQYCDDCTVPPSAGSWACVPGGSDVDLDCVDAGLDLAIRLRDQHSWWARQPKYRHRIGLSNPMNGGVRDLDVDIRRFDDNASHAVLAVDNWYQKTGVTFRYNGILLPVPPAKLSLLEQADLADGDGDLVGDSIDNCPQTANANQWDCDDDGVGDVCNDWCVKTMYSIDAEDGTVSQKGTDTPVVTTSGALTVGDEKQQGKQVTFKGYLSFQFPAEGLPAQAVVNKANLRLTSSQAETVEPNTALGSLLVDVKNGNLGTSAALQTDDFSASASGTLQQVLSVTDPDDQVLSVTATNELGWFNTAASGRTQIRVRFANANDGDTASDKVFFYSGSASQALAPRLEVLYTAP